MTLAIALKEWDLTIRRILAGQQVILLRKGGILEADNQFELEHQRFLFYPTFIHQDPRMVRPEFRAELTQTREEPDHIQIPGYAEVAGIHVVPSREKLEQLADLHIWDTPLLDMRFAYRPEKPLYFVILRAFRLPAPITIPNTLAYAGCKSWVPLNTEIPIDHATQALPELTLTQLRQRVIQTFNQSV